MKKLKTLSITLGAMTALVTPVIVAVSCDNGDDTINRVTIDVTNKSVEQTIDEIVKELHINMDVIGSNEDAWTISDDHAKIKEYMEQIDVNKIITLKNGTKTYEMDFRPIQKWVDKILEAIAIDNNPNFSIDGSVIGSELIKYGMPEIALYAGYTLGLPAGIAMGEFMQLSTNDFILPSASNPDPNALSPENRLFFDNHGYIQMLTEYHDIIWKFINSDFYKEWITGKEFKIIVDGNIRTCQPGEMYDDVDSLFASMTPPLPPKKHGNEIQFSNFELEFGMRLLNGYEYAIKQNPLAEFDIPSFSDSFGEVDSTGIMNRFSDWTINNFEIDSWTGSSLISTLPTGWSKVDLQTTTDGITFTPNPNLAEEIKVVDPSNPNIFKTVFAIYYKG